MQPSFRDNYREIRLDYNKRLKPGRKYRIRLLPVAGDAAGNPITGSDGERWVVVSATGKQLGVLRESEATAGQDLGADALQASRVPASKPSQKMQLVADSTKLVELKFASSCSPIRRAERAYSYGSISFVLGRLRSRLP